MVEKTEHSLVVADLPGLQRLDRVFKEGDDGRERLLQGEVQFEVVSGFVFARGEEEAEQGERDFGFCMSVSQLLGGAVLLLHVHV